jgi:hypothetical protein
MKLPANIMLGSRQILNVPLEVRLWFAFTCGLVPSDFDQPQDRTR